MYAQNRRHLSGIRGAGAALSARGSPVNSRSWSMSGRISTSVSLVRARFLHRVEVATGGSTSRLTVLE